MSDADKAHGAQVLRALDMLEALSGHVVAGLSNKDLAEALRVPPSSITRTADLLITKGWVEKDETSGRFRITTLFSRLTFRVADSFQRAKDELEARQRNYTLSN